MTKYIEGLDCPLAKLVITLRRKILSVDRKLCEHIKLEAPCFFCNGPIKDFNPKEHKRDIVIITTHRGYPLLVFPSGVRIKNMSGVLEGDYKDGRRIMIIQDEKAALPKIKALPAIIHLLKLTAA